MSNPLASAFSLLLENISNAALSLDIAAKSSLQNMQGHCLQICSQAMVYSVLISDEKIHIYHSDKFRWDVRIEGSIPDLTKMLFGKGHGTSVRIDGDELILAELKAIFQNLKPDIETPAANILGEGPAQTISEIIQIGISTTQLISRTFLDAGRSTLNTHASENFLQRDAYNTFLDQVYALKLRTDRLSQRLDLARDAFQDSQSAPPKSRPTKAATKHSGSSS